MRLVLSVAAELGEKFAEVVNKCVQCDSDQGDDLTSGKLQASFYQHVVGELELCERHARGCD